MLKEKNIKIALFHGGKVSQHLVLVKRAARKLGVSLDLISYNNVCFDTDCCQVNLRGKGRNLNNYDILFFRTTGKHWEEVNLILDAARENILSGKTIVVDPLVLKGRPSDACKAYQMLALTRAGVGVPKTVYGSLWYLYEFMEKSSLSRNNFFSSGQSVTGLRVAKKTITAKENYLDFPVILKGSGGDRGTRVFKANNLEELEKLVTDLRKTETEEGKRYMLQEFIENTGDYRVLVLGNKVLGVMKRSSQSKDEFRNNYSAGGKVEVADLPKEIKEMAVKAAEVCGLWVAGVDVMPRTDSRRPFSDSDEICHQAQCRHKNDDFESKLSNNPRDYVILEVNKGPQFKGFMQATGIDVPAEIVKFLVSLKK